MTLTLQVTARTERGKNLTSLRRAGKLPAVVYGAKEESTALTLDQSAFEKVFKEAGESSVITLSGVGADKEVLVHDVDFNDERGGIIHVDFIALEAGKEITVDVPIEFVGEAPAVKLGGTLTKVLHEVEVTCKPKDLPKEFIVDVSSLIDFEAQIHVRDLQAPKNVTIENNPDDVIALVQEVIEEVEEPTVVDMDSIEVEKKGKDEEVKEEEEK